jgi:hypothetical protein
MNKKLAVVIVGIFLMASSSISANAQDFKALLLKSANGWLLEWSNPDTQNSGVTEAIFSDRAEDVGVVVKLKIIAAGANTGGVMSCERNVTIAADTISLDLCRDRKLVLVFDPSDTVYPLKSKQRSENGYVYKVKAK